MRSNEYTFTTKAIPNVYPVQIQVTVKKEFLNIIPEPWRYTYHELYSYSIWKYLHNPRGPAFINLENSSHGYYLDGLTYTKEQWKKLREHYLFDEKIDDIISD